MSRLNMKEIVCPLDAIDKGRTGTGYVIRHPNGEGEVASTLNGALRLAMKIQAKQTSVKGVPGRPPMVKIYEVAITKINPSA